MSFHDNQGYEVTGANAAALATFNEALAVFQTWREDPLPIVTRATEQAPDFLMARALHAYIYLCGRELSHLWKARKAIDGIETNALTEREQLHLVVVNALIEQAHERAEVLLSDLLRRYPRDVLALQVAHAFDYLLGNTEQLEARIARQLPFWTADSPGFAAVSTMLAFGMAENGRFAQAIHWCERALEQEPNNPRVHHVIAHIHEMSGNHAGGQRWMQQHADAWAQGGSVTVHCWWHAAIFHLHNKDTRAALAIYDQHIGTEQARTVANLIDASSLLWRLHLSGVALGARWTRLADKWSRHSAEGFCAFNDMHAMMAFVGASRWMACTALIQAQNFRAQEDDMNAMMTRTVGLPACKGIMAYGLGRYDEAASLLAELPAIAHRIGGSQTQQSIIALTHEAALRRASKTVMEA